MRTLLLVQIDECLNRQPLFIEVGVIDTTSSSRRSVSRSIDDLPGKKTGAIK